MLDAAQRLLATKRFQHVDVLKRYASITDPTRIVVLIRVDEGPVASWSTLRLLALGGPAPTAPRVAPRQIQHDVPSPAGCGGRLWVDLWVRLALTGHPA